MEPVEDAAGGLFYLWRDIQFKGPLTQNDLDNIESGIVAGLRRRADKTIPLRVFINGYGFLFRDSGEVRLVRNALNAAWV